MFLARSIPTVRIVTKTLFQFTVDDNEMRLAKRFASSSLHSVTVNRSPLGERLAWDGEVSFIR